jgi:hypothetical protein
MPIMPAVRRLVARRPWVQWLVVVIIAAAVAAAVADVMAGVETARRSWGSTTTVWIAAHDIERGEPIVVETLEVPLAVRPERAASDPAGEVARQAIGRGEIVTSRDVVDDDGSAPDGWLVAPVRESLPSGAGPGEQVRVVSGGFVIADDAVVVGFVDDVTLVAVPPDAAPLLPAASATTDLALLRIP